MFSHEYLCKIYITKFLNYQNVMIYFMENIMLSDTRNVNQDFTLQTYMNKNNGKRQAELVTRV